MEATFESARQGLKETGASVEEQELVELLARHGKAEGAILQRYQRFVEEGPSPAARYLVRLIIDDERRHHELLAEMANAVAWGWAANSPVAAAPDLAPTAERDEAFIEETAELLAHEEADRDELVRLRRRFKAYKDTTIWTLLIELMLLDTEKHTQILKFLEHHAQGPVTTRKGASRAVLSPGAVAGVSLDRRPTLP